MRPEPPALRGLLPPVRHEALEEIDCACRARWRSTPRRFQAQGLAAPAAGARNGAARGARTVARAAISSPWALPNGHRGAIASPFLHLTPVSPAPLVHRLIHRPRPAPPIPCDARWITDSPPGEKAPRFRISPVYFPPSSNAKADGDSGERSCYGVRLSGCNDPAKQSSAGRAKAGGQRQVRDSVTCAVVRRAPCAVGRRARVTSQDVAVSRREVAPAIEGRSRSVTEHPAVATRD